MTLNSACAAACSSCKVPLLGLDGHPSECEISPIGFSNERFENDDSFEHPELQDVLNDCKIEWRQAVSYFEVDENSNEGAEKQLRDHLMGSQRSPTKRKQCLT